MDVWALGWMFGWLLVGWDGCFAFPALFQLTPHPHFYKCGKKYGYGCGVKCGCRSGIETDFSHSHTHTFFHTLLHTDRLAAAAGHACRGNRPSESARPHLCYSCRACMLDTMHHTVTAHASRLRLAPSVDN
jgi:hypothetical protein